MFTVSLKQAVIASGILIAGYVYLSGGNSKDSGESQYKTRALERGDIVQTISANGTLTPVVLVNVGTQVSGTVAKLHADFNDQVQTGQILAELDPALLRAQLQQSKASLLNAQVTLKIAQSKLRRNQLLKEKDFISLDALQVVEQEVEAARAQLAISKAQVERDQANLDYSVIRSPISGVVIARQFPDADAVSDRQGLTANAGQHQRCRGRHRSVTDQSAHQLHRRRLPIA